MAIGILKIEPNVSTLTDEDPEISVSEIKKREKAVFEGVGQFKGFRLKIPIDTSVEPVCQTIPRIPYHLREKLYQRSSKSWKDSE